MFDSLCRRLIFKKLSGLKAGQITIRNSQDVYPFGDVHSDKFARIDIVRERMFRRVLLSGDVGAAESYMDGDWQCDDLTLLVRIMIANMKTTDRLGQGLASIRRFLAKTSQMLRPNTRSNARKSIHQHYDLGNEFFAGFLDPTMSYSSALFEHPGDSLHQASLNKMDEVCKKLRLNSSHHLLEIGTGWGGLAIFAARKYGCRVTTTTISHEQFRLARHRVRQAGLEDQILVVEKDYRDLQGQFDRIVSIEMIEAVGHRFLNQFFSKCEQLLGDDGLMLLQGIVIRDQRFKFHTRNIDFMRKHIFPGGCLPSVTALLQSMTKATEMRLVHLEDIVAHYPKTLRAWLDNFDCRMDEFQRMGLDEPFIRMWRFYLCYCEAAFIERQVNNVQMLFAGPASRVDVTESSAKQSREHEGIVSTRDVSTSKSHNGFVNSESSLTEETV